MIVGLDWDGISLEDAKRRQEKIEQAENVQTILFETKHGFHLELIYPTPVSVEEGFKIREKYDDCKTRMVIGRKRFNVTGTGHDILFTMKNGFIRKRVW
ncbi:MAG: hypothetical protein DRM98_00430 [Thermoplasmata archaeon]|nr:MAG: hypothetical protein DRM98_00430 [Thermoplasmata archaeon]